MLFEIVTILLIICLILSSILPARVIVSHMKKDRELSRVRDERLNKIVKQVQTISQQVTITQSALNDKMNALSHYVDERNTYVTFQQEQFKILAKSDMLSARRDELMCLKELKTALERIMSMTTMSRQAPAVIDLFAIEKVTDRIKELETNS